MDKEELIESMIDSGALKSDAVIKAFRKVRREEFCIDECKDEAYEDRSLPINARQTISQPTTVAIMTEALYLKKGQKVLEIGAGSGYQAAIIAEVIGKTGILYTIERIDELAEFAEKNLKHEGYNVKVIVGDGSLGLENKAPFDRIIVTACSPKVPETLKSQLKVDGKIVIPVGPEYRAQDMLVLTKKSKNEFLEENLGPFSFVPLIGKEGWKK